VWRYARWRPEESSTEESSTEPSSTDVPELGSLWDAVSNIAVPVLLCRGMRGDSVITDADEVELLRRLPDARIERFEQAGHSIQGDMPVELAAAIQAFVP
jgi:pimeloyl-ACP methyl ester carboxylesterase